jgi:putative metalloprotease
MKLTVIALTLFLGVSSAWGSVPASSVTPIWDELTRTAGIEAGPVTVENKDEPNAWVAFKGDSYSVHITRGLLGIMATRDEVAGVLAHEIGHIKLGHYNETMQRNLLWNILFRVIDHKSIAGIDPVKLGLALTEAGFSREQEVEADDYGVSLATRAGYAPWGLYRSLVKMKDAGFETAPNGFNSHPPTERRLAHVKAKTEEIARR